MGEWWIFLCNLSESPVCLHGHCKKWTWVLWSSTVFKLFILQCSYQKLGPKKYPDPNSKSNTCEASRLTRLSLRGTHLSHLCGGVCIFYSLCLQGWGTGWRVISADCGQKQMVCITPHLLHTCSLSICQNKSLSAQTGAGCLQSPWAQSQKTTLQNQQLLSLRSSKENPKLVYYCQHLIVKMSCKLRAREMIRPPTCLVVLRWKISSQHPYLAAHNHMELRLHGIRCAPLASLGNCTHKQRLPRRYIVLKLE